MIESSTNQGTANDGSIFGLVCEQYMSCGDSANHRYHRFVSQFMRANSANVSQAAKAWKSLSAEEKSAHTL